MAKFHTPKVQPYNVFRDQGVPSVKSRYLPNQYYVEFTPSWWRMAVDNGINYSDLTFLDTLYSWCIQSSPFLVSQINKRLVPITKKKFAIADSSGEINEQLTNMITHTNWWRKLIRARMLSRFYGVKVCGVDVKKDVMVDYPMRNIDIINKALRDQTYGIESVIYIKDYDNMFYMQPETDQDFKLGMLQPISRAMIGIVEAYNNWSVTSATYSFPRTTVGYIDGNEEFKRIATEIAQQTDPLATPVIPFKQNLSETNNVYQIEIKPVQTQMYPNAFEVFKEYIESYRSEIMQLVTGGTLLGATEKNTNSEQLAQIHMGLYEDICDDDTRDVLNFFNNEGALLKIARLLGIPVLDTMQVVEVPEKSIGMDKFEKAMRGFSQVGLQPTPKFFEKIGLEESDVNTEVRNNNWGNAELQNKSVMAKIKETLFKAKPRQNGNGRTTGGQTTAAESGDKEQGPDTGRADDAR